MDALASFVTPCLLSAGIRYPYSRWPMHARSNDMIRGSVTMASGTWAALRQTACCRGELFSFLSCSRDDLDYRTANMPFCAEWVDYVACVPKYKPIAPGTCRVLVPVLCFSCLRDEGLSRISSRSKFPPRAIFQPHDPAEGLLALHDGHGKAPRLAVFTNELRE